MIKNKTKIKLVTALFPMCFFVESSYGQQSNKPYLNVILSGSHYTSYELRTVDAGQDPSKIDHFHDCISQENNDIKEDQSFPIITASKCWETYPGTQMPSDLRIDVYVKSDSGIKNLCRIDSIDLSKKSIYTLSLSKQTGSDSGSSCTLE